MAWGPDDSSVSQACWVPCERACYQTLQWPVSDTSPDPGCSADPGTLPNTFAAAGTQGAGGMPWVPQPTHRLLAICHEEGLRQLVHRHMQRLRHTPLFSRSGKCFVCVSQRVADFVVEACGGPLYYSERHSRLQAGAGLPLLLDEAGREIWLVQLWHAFDDVRFPEHLRADFWSWAEPLSVQFLAPRARHRVLTRYPYDTVRSWFLPGT